MVPLRIPTRMPPTTASMQSEQGRGSLPGPHSSQGFLDYPLKDHQDADEAAARLVVAENTRRDGAAEDPHEDAADDRQHAERAGPWVVTGSSLIPGLS